MSELGDLALPVVAVVLILREVRELVKAYFVKKNGKVSGCAFVPREDPAKPGWQMSWCQASEMVPVLEEIKKDLEDVKAQLEDIR